VTTTVTKLVEQVVESSAQTKGAGAVAALLLIVLLVQYQVFPMAGGSSTVQRTRVYRASVVPLLAAFVVVVVTRLVDELTSA
jgi:hypothetical protein